VFAPTDGLLSHCLTLRPSLWAVVFDTLQNLGDEYSWIQDDPAAATPGEVAEEIRKSTDTTVFAGCVMIGDVKTIARDPVSWELVCDGTVYDRVDYPDLYAVLDPVFIVDADTFAVPDMMDRFTLNTTSVGATGGESSHVLTVAEMPAHTHGEQDPGSVVVQAGTPSVALSDPGLPSQTGSTGGGEAHNNMPPYIGLLPVIVARYPDGT
jgi:microcystin-dependent protein